MRILKLRPCLLGLCFAVCLCGCMRYAPGAMSARLPDLTSATWRLAEIEVDSVTTRVSEKWPDTRIALAFDADSSVSGSSGCNTYHARMLDFTSVGIRFSPLVTTRRACADDRMRLESSFLNIMQSVVRYTLLPDTLILSDSSRANRLIFTAAAEISEAQPRSEIIRGYLFQPEAALIFREWGTSRNDRLSDLTGRLATLRAGLVAQQDESVYVELGVTQTQEPSDPSFSRDLAVHDIYRVLPPGGGPQLDLIQSVVFMARGNGPFWAVRVLPESIILLQPDKDSVMLPISDASQTDTSWQYYAQATDSSEDILRVQIVRRDCFDSMSGAYSWLTAVVSVGQREFTGCAVRGALADH